MNENNDFDFFGLSEIDKIQDEIEKDLSGETPRETPTYNDESFAKFFLVPGDAHESLEPPVNTAPADFYREKIKPAPEKKSWFGVAAALLFVSTLGMGMLGFGIGAGWAFLTAAGNTAAPDDTPRPATEFTTTTYMHEETIEVESLSDVVELIAPSVVGITTHRDESYFFFGADSSYGSGIIFADSDDRIFIATNLYVVRPGYRWDVTIDNSEPLEARPVGTNDDYDLAVAFIYKSDLIAAGIDRVTTVTFGDSDEMRVGDVVLAIGNAMGEGTAVTRGIISAAERPLYFPGRNHPIPLLQTDAAINYGNSGGPLINTRGEIIGINMDRATRLITDPLLAEGMGYSISSNVAKPILMQIIEDYRMPAIGILGGSLAYDRYNRAAEWGIPALGVIVTEVQPGRPADIAGIVPGDVITSFDGQPIFDMPQLRAAIRAKEIGDIVEIRILRGGSHARTVYVELAMMVRDFF